jgi:hypothetical protein
MEELKVYVVSGTEFQSSDVSDEEKMKLIQGYHEAPSSQITKKGLKFVKPGKLPTLQEVVSAIQKDLIAAGVSEWSATIELEVKVGTGSIIPGGSAGIKTTVNIKGKPTETK